MKTQCGSLGVVQADLLLGVVAAGIRACRRAGLPSPAEKSTPPKRRENFVGRLYVSEKHIVIEGVAIFGRKFVDVFLGEKEMAVIKHLEITGEQFARDLVVQRVMGVVAFFEQPRDRDGDLLGIRFRFDRLGGQHDGEQGR